MQVQIFEDEYETVIEHRTCPFNKANPNAVFAGCTCSSSYGSRRRSPEDIARIRAERIKKQEDEILAKADAIRLRRAVQPNDLKAEPTP